MQSKVQELAIESECFDVVRLKFNKVLNKVLTDMREIDSDEGDITVKININIQNVTVQNGEYTRDVPVPVFKHVVQGNVPIKHKLDGREDTHMEIRRENDGEYYLVPIKTAQYTIDEFMAGDIADA